MARQFTNQEITSIIRNQLLSSKPIQLNGELYCYISGSLYKHHSASNKDNPFWEVIVPTVDQSIEYVRERISLPTLNTLAYLQGVY